MHVHRKILGSLGLLIMVIVGLAVGRGWGDSGMVRLDPALRTVVVVAAGEQRPVLRGTDIAVDLEEGILPSGVHRATVLTDTDCAPDAAGVSHCLNELKLGRTTIAVRHHHKMMEEPCFSPPEQLNVVDVATYARQQEGSS